MQLFVRNPGSEKAARRYFPRSVEDLVHWYERYISPLSLIAGFLLDNYVLLRRVDLWQSNILLISYLVIAGIGIVAINVIESGRIRSEWIVKLAPLIPIVVQFCFGGLFSGFLSLYSRSASVAVSWIFVFVLALILLGNERFTRLYVKFSFQISMYFAVLFSFLIFFLPVVFHKIGILMFLLSGVASVLLITLFLWLLSKIVPEVVAASGKRVSLAIAGIFVVLHVCYFLNILPPLPLSLKAAGIYHAVEHTGSDYVLSGERLPWYEYYLNYNTTYHRVGGEPVYVFTSIFAPTGLSLDVVYEWQYHDSAANAWKTQGTVQFAINGGRDGGYRGYALKSNPAEGKWRVNVRTHEGQLIGRVSFTVVASSSTPPLTETTK